MNNVLAIRQRDPIAQRQMVCLFRGDLQQNWQCPDLTMRQAIRIQHGVEGLAAHKAGDGRVRPIADLFTIHELGFSDCQTGEALDILQVGGRRFAVDQPTPMWLCQQRDSVGLVSLELVLLKALDHLADHGSALDGIFSDRRLCREHQPIGAIGQCIVDVVDFSPCRRWR